MATKRDGEILEVVTQLTPAENEATLAGAREEFRARIQSASARMAEKKISPEQWLEEMIEELAALAWVQHFASTNRLHVLMLMRQDKSIISEGERRRVTQIGAKNLRKLRDLGHRINRGEFRCEDGRQKFEQAVSMFWRAL